MNRRVFLKALAALTGASIIPQNFTGSMYRKANAAIDYSALDITAPNIMPQVINVFLYGGPSELSGNLTNIADIQVNSQMSYLDFFPGLLDPQNLGDMMSDGSITPSGFWGSNGSGNGVDNGLGAGGDDMQFLVDNGYMSVYRTMMKRKNTSQAHRESILMSQKGSLDIDFSAGFGYKLAATISEHRALYEAGSTLADGTAIDSVENLIMPFVSIEDGDTRIFDKDGNTTLPVLFNGISLNRDLTNPFTRREINGEETADLDALVQQQLANDARNYSEVIEAFQLRENLEASMATFENAFDAVPAYPNTGFGDKLRAAVTLATENPGTLFITLGGGFGGWDDHNNGVDEYPQRMRELFAALRAAMAHIDAANGNTPVLGLNRPTDNIIINVFGDFGRRVNLNNSLGWDHGNNQNFFTLGGGRAGLRTPQANRGLGNVVGTTVHTGPKNQNDQYTVPAEGSYEFEPMSVASTIFKYFGVNYQNTVDSLGYDPLTSSIDPMTEEITDIGSPPIDEDPDTNGAA